MRGKSYEGFAIGALVGAAGVGVKARAWRRAQDEIDLIVEWAGSSVRWAVEITYSSTKKLGGGFRRGCDETEPTRTIVVQGKTDSARGRDRIERMQLLRPP